MNVLLIKDSTTSINIGFLKYFLDFLSQYKHFKAVEITKDTDDIYNNESVLFWLNAPTNKLDKVWFNKVKLNSYIKKFHIEKILLNSFEFPINISIPTIGLITDKKQITQTIFKDFAQNNSEFIVYNKEISNSITEQYPNTNCTEIIPISQYTPIDLSWDEQLSIKEKYSDGQEYFLINSQNQPIDTILQILKGFSILKKWQKSNIKLLILTNDITILQNLISNYKYRSDVSLVNTPETQEEANLIASSYCTIDLNNSDSELSFFTHSITLQIPCLSIANSTAANMVDQKTFLVEKIDADEVGKAFITMYKAEYLRSDYMDYYKEIYPKWTNLLQSQIEKSIL
jgi:hypothetical protein